MTRKSTQTPAPAETNCKPRRMLLVSICGITYKIQVITKLVRVTAKQISKDDLSTMPVSDRLM